MKILEHGINFKKSTIIKCNGCGCRYKYKRSDIKRGVGIGYMFNSELYEVYVECPECLTMAHLEPSNKKVEYKLGE